MVKTIRVEEAVGMILAHDITEIRPGEFKGPAFRKGYRVRKDDLCHLMRLGKRHLYILDLEKHQVHEDEAALEMAAALAGPGMTFIPEPREGKLTLTAAQDGLFKVDVERLVRFNQIPEVMCTSIHGNRPVKAGKNLAGLRAIPLVIERKTLDAAVQIAAASGPIFSVKPFRSIQARLIITGSEVYSGLIQDKFEPVVRRKLDAYGSTLTRVVILPDDQELIAAEVRAALEAKADLIITTGGMSVDPDDVTRLGIQQAGVERMYYGAAVLPGAMFLLAYCGQTPVIGLPACALHHQTSVFDLILPRLLAGEQPDDLDLARLAYGGYCQDCETCRFPDCAFGKGL